MLAGRWLAVHLLAASHGKLYSIFLRRPHYVSRCEVCRSLVPSETKVEARYRDSVNFVMLNIENSKARRGGILCTLQTVVHFAACQEQKRISRLCQLFI